MSQGWKPLCAFLDVPVPDVPFPHVNDTKEFQQHVVIATSIGYAIAAVIGVMSVLCLRFAAQFV